jgi:hypothetical protein
MSTTNSRQLTLDRRPNGNVEIKVTYNVQFNKLERGLAELGMRFRERIAVIGVDPAGSTTGTVLKNFDPEFITITPGTAPIPRTRKLTVSRALLDEDSNPFVGPDVIPDQIRCRIRIEAIGFPPAVTPDAFTDEEVLSDEIFQTSAVAASV